MGDVRHTEFLAGLCIQKRKPERLSIIQEDNIKMELMEKGCED
jgi:hypothetical protein